MPMHSLDHVHVETIREDGKLILGILAAGAPPGDSLLASLDRILRINADTGPVGNPVRCVRKKIGRAIGVGKDDPKVTLVILLPILQDAIGRFAISASGLARAV